MGPVIGFNKSVPINYKPEQVEVNLIKIDVPVGVIITSLMVVIPMNGVYR